MANARYTNVIPFPVLRRFPELTARQRMHLNVERLKAACRAQWPETGGVPPAAATSGPHISEEMVCRLKALVREKWPERCGGRAKLEVVA
jgi:hypothetical protein